MIEFRMLGRIHLESPRDEPESAGGSKPVDGLVTQSKPLALLAYLLLDRPPGFHRRDELVALFWPELDHRRSRAALSQYLYLLRQHLGPEAIESRGVEELAVTPGAIRCDALEFRRELDEGRPEKALGLYGGELLPGLFVSDALGFERWLDSERMALVQLATAAAWDLAVSNEAQGNSVAASHWARRAASLTPFQEAAIRRLMELLGRLGDRSGALHAFEQYRERARSELELEPSDGLIELAQRIRTDTTAAGAPDLLPNSEGAASPAASETTGAVYPRSMPAVPSAFASRAGSLRRIASAVGVAVLALALYMGARMLGSPGPNDAAARAMDRTIALLPLRVHGGADQARAELYGLRLMDGLVQSGFQVASPGVASPGAGPNMPDSVRAAYRDQIDVDWLLEGELRQDEIGLPELSIRLIDTDREVVVWAFSFREGGRTTSDFVLHVARTTAKQAALHMGLDPDDFRVPRLTDDPVADSLWAVGFFLIQTNYTWQGREQAASAFRAAIDRDSSFVPAYVGLAGALTSASRIFWRPPPRETREEIERILRRAFALDPSYGPLHAQLGWHAYTMEWDWEKAERHYREAIKLDPSHAMTHAMYAFLLVATGRTEEGLATSRRATELAPTPLLLSTYCWHLYLARRFDEAIAVCERVLSEMDPTYPVARAIRQTSAIWRAEGEERAKMIRALPALLREDTMTGAEWSSATWAAIVGDTARALEIIDAEKRHPHVRPFRVANDYAWAGQLDSAFAWLDRAIDSGDPYLPEIYVRPIMDPYRGDPRYDEALRRLDLP